MAEADETIVGIHSVAEALAAGEAVKRVTIAQHRQSDAALKDIVEAAKRSNIPIKLEPEVWFRRFGSVRHQHVAAIVAAFKHVDWTQLRAAIASRSDALIVVADHIEDPQNLGALMRAAEAAGAQGLVIPDRRSAPVTAATRRSAAGAASHLRVASVPNLVRVLEDLKADGFWVSGLVGEPNAKPYTEVDFQGKCALVIGSEGKGLSRLVSERCDFLVKIPMFGKVASLNAAAAGAVVLYEVVRQRMKSGL